METKITHQKIRHLLKKEGLKVGHSYSGKIVDRFSGGLEITKYWDEGVKVCYTPYTFSQDEERDKKKGDELLSKAKEILEKLFIIEIKDNEHRHYEIIVKGVKNG